MVDAQSASAILGKSIRSNAGEDMGRIVDVIVANDGLVRAAVIDFGGFLGVGSRRVAVDWKALQFTSEGKPGLITVALTRNQVRLSPEYKAGEPIVILGAVTTVEAATAPQPAAPAPQPVTPAAQPQPAPQPQPPAQPASPAQPAAPVSPPSPSPPAAQTAPGGTGR